MTVAAFPAPGTFLCAAGQTNRGPMPASAVRELCQAERVRIRLRLWRFLCSYSPGGYLRRSGWRCELVRHRPRTTTRHSPSIVVAASLENFVRAKLTCAQPTQLTSHKHGCPCGSSEFCVHVQVRAGPDGQGILKHLAGCGRRFQVDQYLGQIPLWLAAGNASVHVGCPSSAEW